MLGRMLQWATNLFPFWVLLGGVAAMFRPTWFTWFHGQGIVWGLAVIMLGMGITLSVDDFKRVLTMPRAVLLGVGAQFVIMPFLGWSIARLLSLDTAFAVGLILVSCCPGGTASNVVSYLARANVALSVLMTMCSTFAAVILTPVLTKWLAGAYVPVDAWQLFLQTVKVVLAPVLLGLALHHATPRLVRAVLPVAPLVSVAVIVLICASIIGKQVDSIRESGLTLLTAVLLLHVGGFLLGHCLARAFGYDELIRRTVSIEVGMQNSGLGAVLAQKGFPALPAAATPSAISATFHSIIGSFLAGVWRLRPPRAGGVAPETPPAEAPAAAARTQD
jgi:BASS family bile acid:Na+ symporter